jgi:hypothetical protein
MTGFQAWESFFLIMEVHDLTYERDEKKEVG